MSLKARMELLVEGATYHGVVCDRAPFGLFIELVAGQKEGLLRFDATPYPEIANLFQVGDSVEVVAMTVDVDREVVRVQLLPDPTRYCGFWARNGRANEQVSDGTTTLSGLKWLITRESDDCVQQPAKEKSTIPVSDGNATMVDGDNSGN